LENSSINNKKFDELLKKYQEHAKKHGFRLNKNADIVKNLILALLKKKEKYGEYYCPCRIINPIDNKSNKKIICPCVYHKEEIKKDGHCHCYLFVK